MHEAEHGLASPQRREEGDAVLDIDHEVDVGEVAPVGEWGTHVLAVGATGVDDRIGPGRDRSAAQDCGLVAPLGEADGEAVDEDLGAARLGVGEVPPREEEHAHVRPPSVRA